MKNWPGVPGMYDTGTKTATMVKVVATTARPMASAPSIAAWNGRCPRATRFSMFSISTTASSTRMPMTRVRASRVTTFSEKPMIAMKAKVGTSDTGMAMAVIRVARHSRRNRNTTSEASSMPSSRVCSVAAKLARVSSTVEKIFTNDTPDCFWARVSIAFLTLSSTATSLESRVFITWKATTGRPSRRAKPRCSSLPWPTWATSVSFT